MDRFFKQKVILIAAPVVLILGAVFVLFFAPDLIMQRIRDFSLSSSTVVERRTFFADSLKIFVQHRLTGVGGDGWKYVYPSVQTKFYTVAHPHSYFTEMMTDAGVFGILLYLLMIISFVFSVKKSIKRTCFLPAIISAIMILFHSAFDFDTDYYTIVVFLFIMFAIFSQREKIEFKKSWVYFILPFLLLVWVGLNSISLVNYNKAVSIANKDNASEVYGYTKTAARFMPIKVDYLTTLGNVDIGLSSTNPEYLKEAKDYLNKSYGLNKYNYETITQMAMLCVKEGDYKGAGKTIDKLLKLQPFIPETYVRINYIYESLIDYGTKAVDYDCIRYACNMLINARNYAYDTSVKYNSRIEIYMNVRENVDKAQKILEQLNNFGV